MRSLIMAALLVWSAPETAQAQARLNTETGAGLLDLCSVTDASGREWMCFGYILGVGAMLRDIGSVCFPADATHAKIRDVVVTGLQAHPEERGQRPEMLITKYLTAAFPCPQPPK